MKSQLRDLVASALYPTKAYNLPVVCERFGLAPGNSDEAFSSKMQYVMKRLAKLSDENVPGVARNVIKEFPDDDLQAAIEKLDKTCRLVTDLSRQHVAEALNAFHLAGKRDLVELLRKHWPGIDHTSSQHHFGNMLADDISRHAVENDDWENAEILEKVGFLTCSQAKLFGFLGEIVHPIRRDHGEQENIVATLNPILRRDGFCFVRHGQVSGYPTYAVRETMATGIQPADEIISKALISFDESGVHDAWQKALDRRTTDPEGAITAAKTLLETVCKHIIDEADAT